MINKFGFENCIRGIKVVDAEGETTAELLEQADGISGVRMEFYKVMKP